MVDVGCDSDTDAGYGTYIFGVVGSVCVRKLLSGLVLMLRVCRLSLLCSRCDGRVVMR